VLAALLSLTCAPPAHGVSLPLRHFGLAEGLAGTYVNHLVRDSRGFLWFATSEGLSRFDGESFRNYGVAEGLPSISVADILEDEEGTLWFATTAGLARMRRDAPLARPIERVGGESAVSTLALGRGGIWAVDQAASTARLVDRAGRPVRTLPLDPAWGGSVALVEVPEGLVVGTGLGVRLIAPDGTSRHRAIHPNRGSDEVHALALDRSGRLVIAHGFGLFVAADPARLFETEPSLPMAAAASPLVEDGRLRLPDQTGEIRVLTLGSGPDAPSFVEAATVLPDGRLLAVSRTAVILLERGRVRVLDLSRDIEGASLSAIAEDTAGNFWLGTTVNGAIRMLRSGFDTFGREDGLPSTFLTSVFRDGKGDVYVTAGLSVSRFDGKRFHTARPRVPSSVKETGWGSRQVALFDREGDYWFASGDGLLRWIGPFERLDGRLPRDVFTEKDGLCSRDAFRVFEDRHGDIWVSTFGPCLLNRRDRRTGRIRQYTATDGAPPSTATAFAEDAEGTLWLGSYGDGVFVLEGDRIVRPGSSAPASAVITTIVRQTSGAMLIGTANHGLYVATGGHGAWRFRRLRVRDGLSSDTVLTLVEGRAGLVFVGTPKGVDRIDLATGRSRHMTWENGFPGNAVASLADAQGCLLFATRFGLGRLCEGPETVPPPAPVLLSEVHVGSRSFPVSPFGKAAVDAGAIGPAPLPVEVEFFGVDFVPGERLTYRYRVAALGAGWSAPRPERVVRLAAVPAGRYRLEVEAIRSGEPAGRAAVLTFEVVPPFYRRPLFYGVALAIVVGLVVAFERARVRHLVAVERVRTRIATDLHDDLGSSLSRISILSEVARVRLGDDAAAAGRLLGEIGTTARELIDALSDSIWSVDPRSDDLQSLLDRIRRFAGDVFETQGIAWRLDGPEDAARVSLSPLERRHLFLLVKEALHNVVKHARARSVEVSVSRRGRRLLVTVTDDGVGLGGAPTSTDGRGLASMSSRAGSLYGTFRTERPAAGGTRLVVDVPLTEA
jgi:signal transduction histidine kinase/ligand-binding sensor domain-containing protein